MHQWNGFLIPSNLPGCGCTVPPKSGLTQSRYWKRISKCTMTVDTKPTGSQNYPTTLMMWQIPDPCQASYMYMHMYTHSKLTKSLRPKLSETQYWWTCTIQPLCNILLNSTQSSIIVNFSWSISRMNTNLILIRMTSHLPSWCFEFCEPSSFDTEENSGKMWIVLPMPLQVYCECIQRS